MTLNYRDYQILMILENKGFPYEKGTPAYLVKGEWRLFPSYKQILVWMMQNGYSLQLNEEEEGYSWRIMDTFTGALKDDSKSHGSDEMIAQGIYPDKHSAVRHAIRITLNHIYNL